MPRALASREMARLRSVWPVRDGAPVRDCAPARLGRSPAAPPCKRVPCGPKSRATSPELRGRHTRETEAGLEETQLPLGAGVPALVQVMAPEGLVLCFTGLPRLRPLNRSRSPRPAPTPTSSLRSPEPAAAVPRPRPGKVPDKLGPAEGGLVGRGGRTRCDRIDTKRPERARLYGQEADGRTPGAGERDGPRPLREGGVFLGK